MRDKLLNFFKDKFNITLMVIQLLAIICYFLSGLTIVLVVVFILLEGAFFVLWGIRIIRSTKDDLLKLDMCYQIPYTEEERKVIIKNTESKIKNNRFIGVILILIGIVLIFSLFSIIF